MLVGAKETRLVATVSIPVATAGWNAQANNANTSYRLLYQRKRPPVSPGSPVHHIQTRTPVCCGLVPATSRTPHSSPVTIKTRGGSWSSTGICYEKTGTIKGRRRRRGGREEKRQIWKTLSLSSLKDLIKMDLSHLHTPGAAPTSNELIDHSYRTNGGAAKTHKHVGIVHLVMRPLWTGSHETCPLYKCATHTPS